MKTDKIKEKFINELMDEIIASKYLFSKRKESVKNIAAKILERYDMTEKPVKGPANMSGVVDITKKSNCKCEHCEHWNKNTRICDVTQGSKYYYQRCKKIRMGEKS